MADTAAAPGVERPVNVAIATPPPGSIKYQDRRLVVLYFDLSSMPAADQMRAYSNALKFVDGQMETPDLVAVMTFQGGAVKI